MSEAILACVGTILAACPMSDRIKPEVVPFAWGLLAVATLLLLFTGAEDAKS